MTAYPSNRMKVAQLFRKKRSLLAEFTAEQAVANRALLEQELELLGCAATHYFMEFCIGDKVRRWLLPNETWHDLNDEQVDYVLKNLDWFKSQIIKCQEFLDEPLPL
jgi:hypothetical protein